MDRDVYAYKIAVDKKTRFELCSAYSLQHGDTLNLRRRWKNLKQKDWKENYCLRKIGNMGAKFQPADSFDEFNFKKTVDLKTTTPTQ